MIIPSGSLGKTIQQASVVVVESVPPWNSCLSLSSIEWGAKSLRFKVALRTRGIPKATRPCHNFRSRAIEGKEFLRPFVEPDNFLAVPTRNQGAETQLSFDAASIQRSCTSRASARLPGITWASLAKFDKFVHPAVGLMTLRTVTAWPRSSRRFLFKLHSS